MRHELDLNRNRQEDQQQKPASRAVLDAEQSRGDAREKGMRSIANRYGERVESKGN